VRDGLQWKISLEREVIHLTPSSGDKALELLKRHIQTLCERVQR